ncbi:hypothetical protein A2841_01000 [Candidatus Kaiserbacteria bacterium RIFCSPHIGHO2_01_FULL_48_10]|uniref:Uncharacterized protein n=1 Tax=Candidatus Kaiserbacteria bacterium RIFCSPHIGHO2_01_FULL_48_10 TaxID=1798476 RepID=A0A1F6C5Z5_9BACT|nr:MAG: hypothetical protein A2841_01000 [Candidatus Kaiserbacteria bacterium RIFCSPHIGHO2_01_FULL_48_10]
MNTERIKTFFTSLLLARPARDWLLVLMVGTALLLCEIAYAGYLFYGIQSGGIVGAPDAAIEVTPTVTAADMEKVLVEYRDRKTDFDTRNFNLPPLSDPAR